MFPCFLLHLSLASLSVDSSILACKPERCLPRRLLFSCLGLCGAVQNVVVLKILKTVHRAKRSPSGTDLLSCSLALWSGFSALSGVMARARVYGFSVIWSAIVLYKCLHCRCASIHCLLCRVRFGCVGLLMIITGKDKTYEIKIKTAMQLVWTSHSFFLYSLLEIREHSEPRHRTSSQSVPDDSVEAENATQNMVLSKKAPSKLWELTNGKVYPRYFPQLWGTDWPKTVI